MPAMDEDDGHSWCAGALVKPLLDWGDVVGISTRSGTIVAGGSCWKYIDLDIMALMFTALVRSIDEGNRGIPLSVHLHSVVVIPARDKRTLELEG